MNKWNIISIIFSIIASITISSLVMADNTLDTFLFLITAILAITFTIFYNRKKINKYKHIYNIILILLMILSSLFIICFAYGAISCFISTTCYNNTSSNLEFILLTLSFTFTLIQITDIKIIKSKLNHILTWIISIIVIMIYLRYNYDADFLHNYMYLNQYEIQNSYEYITQNYIYLCILYFSLLMHYIINKNYHN